MPLVGCCSSEVLVYVEVVKWQYFYFQLIYAVKLTNQISLYAAFCALDSLQESAHTDIDRIQTKDLVFFQPLVAKEGMEVFDLASEFW